MFLVPPSFNIYLSSADILHFMSLICCLRNSAVK
jgi:hypothetical protein